MHFDGLGSCEAFCVAQSMWLSDDTLLHGRWELLQDTAWLQEVGARRAQAIEHAASQSHVLGIWPYMMRVCRDVHRVSQQVVETLEPYIDTAWPEWVILQLEALLMEARHMVRVSQCTLAGHDPGVWQRPEISTQQARAGRLKALSKTGSSVLQAVQAEQAVLEQIPSHARQEHAARFETWQDLTERLQMIAEELRWLRWDQEHLDPMEADTVPVREAWYAAQHQVIQRFHEALPRVQALWDRLSTQHLHQRAVFARWEYYTRDAWQPACLEAWGAHGGGGSAEAMWDDKGEPMVPPHEDPHQFEVLGPLDRRPDDRAADAPWPGGLTQYPRHGLDVPLAFNPMMPHRMGLEAAHDYQVHRRDWQAAERWMKHVLEGALWLNEQREGLEKILAAARRMGVVPAIIALLPVGWPYMLAAAVGCVVLGGGVWVVYKKQKALDEALTHLQELAVANAEQAVHLLHDMQRLHHTLNRVQDVLCEHQDRLWRQTLQRQAHLAHGQHYAHQSHVITQWREEVERLCVTIQAALQDDAWPKQEGSYGQRMRALRSLVEQSVWLEALSGVRWDPSWETHAWVWRHRLRAEINALKSLGLTVNILWSYLWQHPVPGDDHRTLEDMMACTRDWGGPVVQVVPFCVADVLWPHVGWSERLAECFESGRVARVVAPMLAAGQWGWWWVETGQAVYVGNQDAAWLEACQAAIAWALHDPVDYRVERHTWQVPPWQTASAVARACRVWSQPERSLRQLKSAIHEGTLSSERKMEGRFLEARGLRWPTEVLVRWPNVELWHALATEMVRTTQVHGEDEKVDQEPKTLATYGPLFGLCESLQQVWYRLSNPYIMAHVLAWYVDALQEVAKQLRAEWVAFEKERSGDCTRTMRHAVTAQRQTHVQMWRQQPVHPHSWDEKQEDGLLHERLKLHVQRLVEQEAQQAGVPSPPDVRVTLDEPMLYEGHVLPRWMHPEAMDPDPGRPLLPLAEAVWLAAHDALPPSARVAHALGLCAWQWRYRVVEGQDATRMEVRLWCTPYQEEHKAREAWPVLQFETPYAPVWYDAYRLFNEHLRWRPWSLLSHDRHPSVAHEAVREKVQAGELVPYEVMVGPNADTVWCFWMGDPWSEGTGAMASPVEVKGLGAEEASESLVRNQMARWRGSWCKEMHTLSLSGSSEKPLERAWQVWDARFHVMIAWMMAVLPVASRERLWGSFGLLGSGMWIWSLESMQEALSQGQADVWSRLPDASCLSALDAALARAMAAAAPGAWQLRLCDLSWQIRDILLPLEPESLAHLRPPVRSPSEIIRFS